jgi:hypothetical protein
LFPGADFLLSEKYFRNVLTFALSECKFKSWNGNEIKKPGEREMLKIESEIKGSESQVKWATEIRNTMLKQIDALLENAKRRAGESEACKRFAEIVEKHVDLAVKRLATLTASQLIDNRNRSMADMIEHNARKEFNA